MTKANSNLQFHLTTNANEIILRECLFQLYDIQSKIEIFSNFLSNKRIIMFLSFRLQNVEIKYFNFEKECYVIIKTLIEVRWLIIDSRFLIMIYINYETLKSIFVIEQIEKKRIIIWLNRLKKFDLKLHHQFSRCQHIELANVLSKMFIRLHFTNNIDFSKKLTTFVIEIDKKRFNESKFQEIKQHNDFLNYMIEKNLKKYKRFSIYRQIMKYLLKEKKLMNVQNVSRNCKKTLRWLTKYYRLFTFNESRHLRYQKNNDAINICIVEKKIKKFLKINHENHEHFVSTFTFDYFVNKTYWSNKMTNVKKWCQNCHVCQTRFRKSMKNISLFI